MIWCLHGFLGTGDDWLPFADAFREASGQSVTAPDLFDRSDLPPLGEAALPFTRGQNQAIVGYSMGGRLALHALVGRPEAFRAAVIISAGLGVSDESERQQRKSRDEEWAGRFENDPWPEVVADWNRQPLFQGSVPPAPRTESPRLRRDALAAALRRWSPATHPALAKSLPAVPVPLLWIAGERDRKYVQEGERAVSLLPNATLWTVPDAGHRPPWEQIEVVRQRISDYLARAFSR